MIKKLEVKICLIHSRILKLPENTNPKQKKSKQGIHSNSIDRGRARRDLVHWQFIQW